MEDSPRSAKRRRIETTTGPQASPVSRPKRTSGRLAARAPSHSPAYPDVEEDDAAVEGAYDTTITENHPSRTSSRVTRRRAGQEDKNIYDDFDGAFGEPTPKRKTRGTPKKPDQEDTEASPKPHPFKGTGVAWAKDPPAFQQPDSKLKRLRPSRTAHGPTASNTTEGRGLVPGAPNDEAEMTATPPHGRKVTKTVSTRKVSTRNAEASPASKIQLRARRPADAQNEEKDTIQVAQAPASSSRARKASSAHTEDTGSGVDDTDEDELIPVTPSKSARAQRVAKKTPTSAKLPKSALKATPATRARRANNRADHAHNRDDTVTVPDTEEDELAVRLDTPGTAGSIDNRSIAGSILDPAEPSPFNPIRKEKETDTIPILPGELASGRELDLLKKIVLERITGRRPSPLSGLDEEYKIVHQLVEHTVTAGEGNSLLLIGARGSGKTALVNKVMSDVAKDNPEDFHIVRLNGFLHTDDKIALREIWRQLGKEMEIEEDGIGKNYADTLTTLLALLSHPSEQTGEETDQVAKAVIFVMDEFDLFATHPRQTLLYNLFDIAQSRKAPIAVLGLTTRIDVADSLEKRVKSRFSHRYVHLSLAKSFTAFQEICKAALIVESEHLSVEERALLSSSSSAPKPKPTPTKRTNKGTTATSKSVLEEWNTNIQSLFSSKSFLTTFLAPNYYLTKSPTQILTSFLLPTLTLASAFPPLPPENLTLSPPSSNLSLLPHLSTLQLSLLISAARLDIIHDSDTCNFNMVYEEYVSLASKARIQSAAGGAAVASGNTARVWGREVARREWEGLITLGLVVPVNNGGGGGSTGTLGGFGMCRVDVGLEEVGAVLGSWVGGETYRGLERWCRQI